MAASAPARGRSNVTPFGSVALASARAVPEADWGGVSAPVVGVVRSGGDGGGGISLVRRAGSLAVLSKGASRKEVSRA